MTTEARAARNRYPLGLVVGKFAPLHLGHEWLIDQAAAQCDRLFIVSYTKPEFAHCDVPTRSRWLAQRFPQHESVVIDDAWLQDACAQRGIAFRPIPPNEDDDATQQAFFAWLIHDVLQRQPDAMFCSEAYGPPTAALLSRVLNHEVQAVVVDQPRLTHPISARAIRNDPHGHAQWMSPEVHASFVKRIVLLGGESTGKTTLAKALAERFNTLWVPEYGRELWEKQGGVLSEADMLHIGREQVRREEQALLGANRYLFCDTSPLTTLGYSHWMFGCADLELALLGARAYDGVVLCLPDFPFVQDGTRRDESFRDTQQDWYLEQVQKLAHPLLQVGGSLDQRVARGADWLAAS